MPPFNFVQSCLQIQGMYRIIQRPVDADVAPAAFGQLMPDQRPQAVPGDPVAADTQNDNLLPHPVRFLDTLLQQAGQLGAGGGFSLIYIKN